MALGTSRGVKGKHRAVDMASLLWRVLALSSVSDVWFIPFGSGAREKSSFSSSAGKAQKDIQSTLY